MLVGNTIGAGILRTPGEMAARLSSVPLFMGVWVAGAVYALLGALTVAELAAMRPRSGGLYPLVRYAIGGYAGFVAGWTDWLGTSVASAAVALVLGEYTGPLLAAFDGKAPLIGAFVVIVFALLQWRGIQVGNVVQQITSLLKAVALLALAALSLALTDGAGPSAVAAAPLVPGGLALAGAVVVALQSAIVTYDGWTGPVYFGDELRDPERDIPRSMIGGVLLVLAIYLALNAAFLRVIPIAEMAGDPFVAASAAARVFGPRGDLLLRLVMLVSLVAAVNANLLMTSRVPFAMSQDGLLPAWLRRVERGTPVTAMTATVAVILVCLATNFEDLLAVVAFLYVANYTLTFAGLFVSRRREPLARRPFRVPWYPVVPGVALAGSITFLLAAVVADPVHSVAAVALVALSWPVYAFAARRGKE